MTGEIVPAWEVERTEAGALLPQSPEGAPKDGVLASTIAPRNRPGRPTQTQIEAMQAAITNACPPARVEELINEAIEYARFHKSPKAIVSILELVFDRTIGAVVPAQPEQPDGLELVLTRLRATWTQSQKTE